MNWPLPSFWETSLLSSPDLVIIGGGFTGLQTALEMKHRQPGWKILVLESRSWGAGASTRNAGFACFGSPSELMHDIRSMGEAKARQLVEDRYLGLQQLRARLSGSDVEWEESGGQELFGASQKELFAECMSALPYLNELIGHITGTLETYQLHADAPEGFMSVKIKGEAMLHPGKAWEVLLQLCRQEGVQVLQGVHVKDWENQADQITLRLENGVPVVTPRLVITVNAWAANLVPELDVQPARGLVLLTEPLGKLPIYGTYHMDEGYIYFRNYGQRLLIGGCRNLDFDGESSFEQAVNPNLDEALFSVIRELLPGREVPIATRWTGTMGMGSEKSPIVKQVAPHIWAGVRMSGMGVALSARVAQQLAHMIV